MTVLGSQGEANNYTLGRGEVFVARYVDFDTDFTLEGERYIGNTPEFSLTIQQQTLDHFSSDRGIKEKDDSVPLQVDRTGSLTVDNVNTENVALFFFGSHSTVTDAGGAFTEVLANVEQGKYYPLGVSASYPAGRKGFLGETEDSNSSAGYSLRAYNDSNSIDPEVDSNSGNATYVKTTDYVFDADRGVIYIVVGGGIADGADVFFSGTVKAATFSRVISGSEPVVAAVRFVAFNPTGDNIDYFMPYVKVSPNGDYALKSDEWQKIPLQLEVLKRSDREAIYADGRPDFT